MKKLIVLALVCAFTATVVGCGGSSSSVTTTKSTTVSTEKTK